MHYKTQNECHRADAAERFVGATTLKHVMHASTPACDHRVPCEQLRLSIIASTFSVSKEYFCQ
jgi:hypothetical protein